MINVREIFRLWANGVNRYWWCVIVALAVLICPYCTHYLLVTNPDGARYLLSAISQSLSAILALVFTITLVVLQMTKRYTAVDMILSKPGTRFLMIIFAIGIILPFIVLKIGSVYTNWRIVFLTNLSIAFAVFCVLSVFPFLMEVNATLKEIGIEKLSEEANESLDEMHWSIAVHRIRELGDLGIWAANTKRQDFASKTIKEIELTCEEAIHQAIGSVATVCTEKLQKIGVEVAKKEMQEATTEVIEMLTNIMDELSEIDLDRWQRKGVWGNTIHALGEVSHNCKEGFFEIGKTLIENSNLRIGGVLEGLRKYYSFTYDRSILAEGADNGGSVIILGAYIVRSSKNRERSATIQEAVAELLEVKSIIGEEKLENGFNEVETRLTEKNSTLLGDFKKLKQLYARANPSQSSEPTNTSIPLT